MKNAGGVRAFVAFVRLSRLLFLYGGFAGVAFGAAVAAHAGRVLDVATYVWAQVLVTAFHLMVHYANEYFDAAGDALARRDARTAWSGGSGILVDGALPARVALVAALFCAVVGLVATARFALAGNAVVAALGVAILAFAWFYSAPPLRFAARGLGEADAALVVAVLVPAVGYAAFAHGLDVHMLAATIPTAAAMFAMMLSVELPDAGADHLAGKRTLVVRWGPSRTWPFLAGAAWTAAVTGLATAFRVAPPPFVAALVPSVVAAVAVAWFAVRDPRPATLAFWGVALYATTVTGLAVVYGVAPSTGSG